MASSRRGQLPELELENQNGSANPIPSSASAAEDDSVNSEGNRGGDQQPEPADQGVAAWKVLCAAFMFEAVLWGEISSCPEEDFIFRHHSWH